MGGARASPARLGTQPTRGLGRVSWRKAELAPRLTAPALVRQIFNLMKFDSYARFVKSPLYRECLLAEAEGRPLREPGSSSPGSPDSTRKVRTRGCGKQICRAVPLVCTWAGVQPGASAFPVPAEAEAKAREVAAAGRGGVGAPAFC